MDVIKCNFEKIKNLYSIKNSEFLIAYLNDIYKDISLHGNVDGIEKLAFIKFMSFPFLLGEKVFSIFDTNDKGYLTWDDFSEGIDNIFLSNLDDSVRFVFQLFDFDKDGRIIPEDVRLIITYLSSYQMGVHKSIDEINCLIINFFDGKKAMHYEDFIDTVENRYSDVYYMVLLYLFENTSLKNGNVELYCLDKNRAISKINKYALTTKATTMREDEFARKRTIAQPTHRVKEYGFDINVEKIIKRDTQEEDMENDLLQLDVSFEDIIIDTIVPRLISSFCNLNSFDENISVSPVTRQRRESNKIYKQQYCKSTKVNILNLNQYKGIKSQIIHEGYLYKYDSKLGKKKKFYIILLGNDMFYFKSSKLDKLKGIHNLSNSYVHDEIEETGLGGRPVFVFTVYFNHTKRQFYCKTLENCKFWLDKFHETLKHRDINDYYKILEAIGRGSFSKVYHGVDLNTLESVAIKVIHKNRASNNLENIKNEIEIMKFCKNDNIVKYIDHFEDFENIYIVEEYLKGGDLYTYYVDKFKSNPNEKALKNIIRQIGNGLKYLHDYGIIHRDIKLQNILLTDKNDNPVIKISDFGLSKVTGSKERVSDCLGTLNFSAPEVVSRSGYNNKVDIWSLGVLLYFMTFNLLPFNDKERNKENIVYNICNKEVKFNRNYISQQLYDLLKLCFEKEYEKRIDINEFLSHKWFS
jgi:Ca2+-binding EF-hand superfamily protein